jgi:uncharacterized protein YggE
MKKYILVAAIVAAVSGCMTTQANVPVNGVEKGFISVNTSANAEIIPDIAEISIAVVTSDHKSMQKATLQNKEISDKVISTLKSMINTSNGDYIKTSNFNASPIYIYNGNKKSLDKYQVSNSVVIHTKNVDKVGSMIDKSIELGATNVNSLNFSVSSYESKCNELITIAANRAKERANAALKTVPTTISGVKTMDVSCSENNVYRPQYRMLKSNLMMADGAVAAEAAPQTTIEQGVVKIYANVNASYYVK